MFSVKKNEKRKERKREEWGETRAQRERNRVEGNERRGRGSDGCSVRKAERLELAVCRGKPLTCPGITPLWNDTNKIFRRFLEKGRKKTNEWKRTYLTAGPPRGPPFPFWPGATKVPMGSWLSELPAKDNYFRFEQNRESAALEQTLFVSVCVLFACACESYRNCCLVWLLLHQ